MPSLSVYLNKQIKMVTDINNIPICEALEKNGYVVIDGLIPIDAFQRLTEACDRVVDRARCGN